MFNPIFVRDSFVLGKWYIYIKLPGIDGYWIRYDFGAPLQDMTNYSQYLVLTQICYGTVYEGQVVNPGRDHISQSPHDHLNNNHKWEERPGYWSTADSVGGMWTGRIATATGAWSKVPLPSGHNIIKVTCDVRAGYDTVQFSWDKQVDGITDATSWSNAATDGIDLTEQSMDGTSQVTEFTIATNANPNGRKLMIWKKGTSGEVIRVFAVRSWNTKSFGDPSTITSDPSAAVYDIAAGHGMIDTFSNMGNASKIPVNIADIDMTVLTADQKAHDFAFQSAPHGQRLGFTGSQHFNVASGDYPYTYATGSYLNGPTILVGDSLINAGDVFDSTLNPLGIVHTDTKIQIQSIGYPKWNRETPPEITWTYEADSNGLTSYITVKTRIGENPSYGSGLTDFSSSAYTAMLPLNSELSAYYKTPLSDTEYRCDESSNQTIEGASSYTVYIPSRNIRIRCLMNATPYGVLFVSSSRKIYCWIDPRSWGTYQSGTSFIPSIYTLPEGSEFSFSGRYEIEYYTPIILETNLSNSDNNFQDGQFPLGDSRVSLFNEHRADNALSFNSYS